MSVMVIMSGGLDSTTVAYHYLRLGEVVLGIGFDYGQRHRRELCAAEDISRLAGIDFQIHTIPMPRNSALTSTDKPVPHGHYTDSSMRQTVVPYRNLIFIAHAAAAAVDAGCDTLAYGAHSGDAAIYPDCRPAFFSNARHALYHGDYARLEFEAPLIGMNKRQVAQYAVELGVPIALTWSCYEGDTEPCGKCGACVARMEALA